MGVKILAYALFGVIGKMHRVVKPPCPVIVPQVVVWVLVIQSNGQIFAIHFLDNISINQT